MDLQVEGTPDCATDGWTATDAAPYAATMARYELCPNCEAEMPVGNVHCFACGADIPPPRLDSGSILIQLYPAVTQGVAFEFYRVEAARLAAAGWYPVAHSWGDERAGAGYAALLGDVAATQVSGTLLVTYRQGGRA
jgi:hypothetical protein